MTPSKKLFIAAVILAAGYGVATLLGTPVRPLLPDVLRPAERADDGVTSVPWAASTVAPSAAVGSVRLLPDATPSTNPSPWLAAENAPSEMRDSALGHSRPTDAQALPHAEPNSSLLASRLGPRARLKLEPPRPLPDQHVASEMTSPASTQAVSMASAAGASSSLPATSNAEHTPSFVWPAQHAADALPTAATFPAANVSAQSPVTIGSAVPVSPPPWPTFTAPPPQRTHVVVDGDSLAKLAGRYLDDPRRSDEIFELNRGLLSDPELLPIGVELAIPAPGQIVDVSRGGPQSLRSGQSPLHAATSRGLVPIRPIPSDPGVTLPPRAQLLTPRPVE